MGPATLSARSMQMGDVALKSDGNAGVKSDTLDLKRPAIGFSIAAAGAIKVRTDEGEDVTLPGTFPAGHYFACCIRRVFSTGTALGNGDILLYYSKV